MFNLTYYTRYRMVLDLRRDPAPPRVPPGYFLVPWDESLIDLHADVQHRSFCGELDAEVFPCFGDLHGCRHLLRTIRRKPGFLGDATWLVACGEGCCGTVQCAIDLTGDGGIQNLGVVPEHRGRGLGKALMTMALLGFREWGVPRVTLEVTAENEAALSLYHGMGFRKMKTVYKAVD